MSDENASKETRGKRGKPFTSENQPAKRGRPPGRLSLTTLIKAELIKKARSGDKTRAQAFVESLLNEAESGSVHHQKVVLAYVDGLPVQAVEVAGPNGGPIEVVRTEIVRPDDKHTDR